jgi:hypothetical protein
MHLDSLPLPAPLTHTAALAHNGLADWSPTSGVFDMHPAAPVGMIFASVKFGEVFPHARHRTEHASFTSEVTSRTFERDATPRANTGLSPAASNQRLADLIGVVTSTRTESFSPIRQNRSTAFPTAIIDRFSPSAKEVASRAAIRSCASRVGRECSSARPTYALPTGEAKPLLGAVGLEYGRTPFTRLRLVHTNSIANFFEISTAYILFAPKPEQLSLGGE